MKTVDQLIEEIRDIPAIEAIGKIRNWGESIIEECKILSQLKWSAGESGILTREDAEILKEKL